jgi:YaiO family outer membrane protein
MQHDQVLFTMRYASRIIAGLGAISVAGIAMAQAGLWDDHGGLGLRPSHQESAPLTATSHTDPLTQQQASSPRDYELYSGVRELPRLGPSVPESYSGVAYTLSRKWGTSLEAGVTPESASAPRRYSLAGQLRTALSDERGVSVGLKYRHYDERSGLQDERYGDPLGNARAHELTPSAVPGLSSRQSYEVRLRYDHSTSSSFGLVMGRDLETLTPSLGAGTNGERQLMFTGQHWLTPSWGLSYDLLSDEPGSSMRVQGLRLGVRYRF